MSGFARNNIKNIALLDDRCKIRRFRKIYIYIPRILCARTHTHTHIHILYYMRVYNNIIIFAVAWK